MLRLAETVERELVTDSIAVEQVADNVFLSRSLWVPYGHPSAYGGQVMSQAIHAASEYANHSSALHSYQCCFLHSTTNELPIKYRVYRLKHGRTFSSYIVKASQNRRLCVVLTCWFKTSEPTRSRGLSSQWSMPGDAPHPEELELDGDYYRRQSTHAGGDMKQALLGIAQDRERIPIILTVSVERISADGYFTSLRWMKVPSALGCSPALQTCILAYICDFDFIGAAPKALRLKRLGRGPGTVEAISTLSHSMQFYCEDIDCSDWLLFAMSVPCTGFERASVLGRFYAKDGTLVAVAMQEGMVRTYGDDGKIGENISVLPRSKL